jgi:hypothetical protein
MIKRFYIFYFFAAILALEACKNNDSVYKTVIYTGVNVVNASADTLNYYLNGTRQNNGSSLYSGGQSFYLPVPVGAENFQFKKAGAFNVLFSVPLTLKDSTNYSLYVAGETADNSFSTIDDIDTTGTQNGIGTRIRFVNASPTTGNLDVTIGDTLSYTARPFKSSSNFLHTGSGTKEVKVLQGGSAIIDTPITFQPGRVYSLVSRGMVNGVGSKKFTVGIVINF